MSAASEFIRNRPVLSYLFLLVTFSLITIVSIAIFTKDIDEKIPSAEYIDGRIDFKIQQYDSTHAKIYDEKLNTIIELLGGDPNE